jgi:lysophospholipid hydrolase
MADDAALHEIVHDLEWVTVPMGATLLLQGERADALYIVVDGCLQAVLAHVDGGESVINDVGPGEVVGEIPLVTGGTRIASLSAHSPTTLLKCPHMACHRLFAKAPQVRASLATLARRRLQRIQMTRIVGDLFGALDAAMLCDIEAAARLVSLPRGATLCRQGETGQCLYIVVSGRLQVTVTDTHGQERVIGEIGRGESVGEMALFTGERRSASVVASRDSVLLQFPNTEFARLLATYPQVGTYTSQIISRRLQQARHPSPASRGTTHVAVVPASPQVPLTAFTRRLAAALASFGATAHLSSVGVDSALGVPGIAHTPDDHPNIIKLMTWLDEQETRHRFVCYEVDPWPSPWSKRCFQQADQVLLVGEAAADPQPGVLEMTLLRLGDEQSLVQHTLVLIHPDGSQAPTGTSRWLAPRHVTRHYHLRWDTDTDVTRLARALAGQAVGLVLSGGGARSYAHIGVIRALVEAGIPIDLVGGTSMGALIAAEYALGWDEQTMRQQSRALFTSPFDYTVPIVALAAGRWPAKKLQGVFGNTHIEDLWLPYFCISSNLTRAEMVVHRTGPVWQGIRASSSLPGLLPPVAHEGDWLVDGAVLNNLPVDVMHRWCEGGPVIAVDVSASMDMAASLADGETLSGWHVFWQKVNPFATKRQIPTILSLLYRAAELSSRYMHHNLLRQGLATLYLNPPVAGFELLDFAAGDTLAALGYHYAKDQIGLWQYHPACPTPGRRTPRSQEPASGPCLW